MNEAENPDNSHFHTRTKQALSADHEELHHLIRDTDPEFLRLLLNNPHLNEEHLLVLLQRRDLEEKLINLIYRAHRSQLSHRLLLAIVKNPRTSAALIRALLPHLRLFELLDLCLLPGGTPDLKLASERSLLQRIPTTPLGNKITLARRGTSSIVGELLKEGHQQICAACLDNPRLKEAAVFQFIRGATATPTTLSMIARHNRWKERPNLKLAILKHRQTPSIWYTLWLPQLNLSLLKQLQLHFRSTPAKNELIARELKKR